LFDKDGTLFGFADTWGGWCERVVAELAPGNAQLQQSLANAVGYDTESKSFTTGSAVVNGSADETARLWAELLPDLSINQVESIGLRVLHDLPLQPVTDLHHLFSTLKQAGLVIGLATNDYESAARTHLAQLQVTDQFDFICGFDSGYGSKPEPGMIHAFCRHTGLQPQQVAMIGDSTHDLHAGRAAGAGMTIGVLTGPAVREDLVEHADAVVHDISALPGLLAL
ncbi:MAG: HAD family hydrolase, partial [Pseudomonadota bacterium]